MKLAERMNRIGVESAFEVLLRARELERQGRNIIHLEIGEPDFATPSHIVEAAKILSDETPGKDFRLAAVIPQTVLDQAMIEGWFHDKAAWRKWAKDPDNRAFNGGPYVR